ncbi:MAG: EamA family transporter [Nanoarchaeota archaeon]|nr:EamA family transporter [Nanoarchaeota archaeon]
MVGWGILFVFIDVLVSRLDWFLPILIIKALGIPFILAYSSALKRSISFPQNVGLFVVLGGILEAIAFLAFGFGITSENTSIIAPIVFAFPAVTIILARIFFKEILELNQKIGVAVLSGLVLLSV